MITVERMQKILNLELQGMKQDLNEEESKFLLDLREDIKLANEREWIIVIPSEWEV